MMPCESGVFHTVVQYSVRSVYAWQERDNDGPHAKSAHQANATASPEAYRFTPSFDIEGGDDRKLISSYHFWGKATLYTGMAKLNKFLLAF